MLNPKISKTIRKPLSLILLFIFIFSLVPVLSFPSNAMASLKNPAIPSVKRTTWLQESEIEKAKEYIIENSDGKLSVSSKILLSGISLKAQREIKNLVNKYNNSSDPKVFEGSGSSAQLQNTGDSLSVSTMSAARFSCSYQWYYQSYWWGYRLWINDCIIQDLGYGYGGVSAVAGTICAAVTWGICGMIWAILSGAAAFGFATLSWMSYKCGGRGVNTYRSYSGQNWLGFAC